MYKNDELDAISASRQIQANNSAAGQNMIIPYKEVASNTDLRTFSIRAATATSGTVAYNGDAGVGTRLLGGALFCCMLVFEIKH